MNKYTLSFTDQAFEKLFQNHIQKSYTTMCYSIIFGLAGSLVLLLIQNLQRDYQLSTLMIYYLLTIVYLMCQFLFIRKYKKWQLFVILSNNFIVMCGSINVKDVELKLSYFTGQNMMCFHSIIFLILDFKIAAVNNLILFIWRVTMLILQVDAIYYSQLSSAAFVQITLMVCLYIKCKAQRELFLLYMKDQKWEKLIPDIISKPLFIFTFDEKHLKFIENLSVPMEFLKSIENPLQHLLRHTQYLGNTLERYIFRKFKQYDSEVVEKTEILRVKYQKESKILKLTTFKLNIVTLIITVEDEDLNIQILKKEEENNAKDWKRTMKQQLQNQIRVMRNLLQTRNKTQLQNILIHYSQIILFQQLERNIIQTVDLTKLLSGIIREFRMRIIKLITSEQIDIQTQKSKMLILLMEITKQLLKQDKLILIQLGKFGQSVVMTIKTPSPFLLKQNKSIVGNICNELLESVTYLNGSMLFFFIFSLNHNFLLNSA